MTVLLSGFVLFYTVASLPVVQQLLGQAVSAVLTREAGSRVRVASVDASLPLRPVLDGVTILDQQGDTLLDAARLAARLQFMPLLGGRVSLPHIQLYRPHIHLRQDSAGTLNCQYLIDLFSSDGGGGDGPDVEIGTIMLRRGQLTYDRDTLHHEVTDLAATIYRLKYEEKVLSAYLHDMHLKTYGVEMSNLSAHVALSPYGGIVSDLILTTPYSRFSVMRAMWNDTTAKWRVTGGRLSLSANDLPAALLADDNVRRIASQVQWIDGRFAMTGTRDVINIDTLQLTGDGLDLDAVATITPTPLNVDIDRLTAHWRRGTPTDIDLSGYYNRTISEVQAHVTSGVSMATIDALMTDNDQWRVRCRTDRFRPSTLLSYLDVTEDIVRVMGDSANVTLNLTGDGSLRRNSFSVSGDVRCQSRPLVCDVTGHIEKSPLTGINVSVSGSIPHVRPSAFGGKGRLATYAYSTAGEATLRWPAKARLQDMDGQLRINHLEAKTDSTSDALIRRGLVVDATQHGDDERRLSIYSDFMNVYAALRGDLDHMVSHVWKQLSASMPTLVAPPVREEYRGDELHLSAQIWDTRLINFLSGADAEILDTLDLRLVAGDSTTLTAHSDSMRISNEVLRGIDLSASVSADSISLSAKARRDLKDGTAAITLDATAADDMVGTRMGWTAYETDGEYRDGSRGRLCMNTQLGDTMRVSVMPSKVLLRRTLWDVPTSEILVLPDGALDISHLAIESGDRHLRLQGRLSGNPADTLRATLRRVNLGYIFDLVDFHDVEFDGDATGLVKATGLTSSPRASGELTVEGFSFNRAVLGDLALRAEWRTEDGQLDVDGHITGPGVPSETFLAGTMPTDTRIVGRVNPGKNNPRTGLDLDVQAQGFNLGFLNVWTDDIFDRLHGSITGHVRLYGPFNGLDLDGAVAIDHCTVGVPVLGTRYQSAGDSVRVSAGRIHLDHVQLYDQHASHKGGDHRLVADGALMYEHFKHMRYDFRGAADNILGYDIRTFGDEVFYGTAYLTGGIHLWGGPGRLDVEVSGTTMPGSLLVYDSTTPDALTDSNFITYVQQSSDDSRHTDTKHASASTGTDINLSFDVNVTPDAALRVLMDMRTGDYLELHGNAPIQAEYYNKGAFRMRGTYVVERGNYHMTLRDFIAKDFTFRQGGTIVFPGSPMQAALDLQAVYTVPRVNLNDLASTAMFSSTRVPVNCLMNLTGTAGVPQVSFDFDLPNATQDEAAIVRSLVSTEEERNLQAVYLLGLGTFYAQGNDIGDSRGNTAINSFLSSTLSSQINSVLGDVIGSRNWSFGTNISTGQDGWNEVQAEGSLSGRLFNDRLLINGSFGYRDGARANQTGFVGDFDMQWLLTPRGTVSLKAYSQTTDRYFTKSGLTTQGLGLVLKKDFTNLRDLFNMKKKK